MDVDILKYFSENKIISSKRLIYGTAVDKNVFLFDTGEPNYSSKLIFFLNPNGYLNLNTTLIQLFVLKTVLSRLMMWVESLHSFSQQEEVAENLPKKRTLTLQTTLLQQGSQ